MARLLAPAKWASRWRSVAERIHGADKDDHVSPPYAMDTLAHAPLAQPMRLGPIVFDETRSLLEAEGLKEGDLVERIPAGEGIALRRADGQTVALPLRLARFVGVSRPMCRPPARDRLRRHA